MKKYFITFSFALIGSVGLGLAFAPHFDSGHSLLFGILSLAAFLLFYFSYGHLYEIKKLCESYRSLNNSDCVIRLLLELDKDDLKDLISCMSESEIVHEIERLQNRIEKITDENRYHIARSREELDKIDKVIKAIKKTKKHETKKILQTLGLFDFSVSFFGGVGKS